MDDNEIKGALDSFENDDFITAKEKLKGQISGARDEFLKKKLGLEKDINPVPDANKPPDSDKSKVVKKSDLTGR